MDIHSAPFFDVTCVFTGGSPAGTLTLQKSNDLQWEGGNRPQPRASSPNAPYVSDAVNAPTGFGTVSASVSGAGVYNLNQYYVGYRWFRVVYSASANVVTQLDIFCNWKK